MIIFSDSKIMKSIERPVQVGSTITAEGSALVATTTSGVFGVQPSAGASNEQFCGVSLAQQLTLLYFPAYDSLIVNSSLVVTTTYTPSAGTLFVYNVTRSAVVAAGSSAGNYAISGQTVTVVTGGTTQIGDNLQVAYRFSPTTLQALSVMGNIPAGGAAALTLGSVGTIVEGDVVTTEFDTSQNWAAANIVIKTGANGLFTIGGSGATVNGYVTAVPSNSYPYLGVHFAA
jgi:hypothetical protein